METQAVQNQRTEDDEHTEVKEGKTAPSVAFEPIGNEPRKERTTSWLLTFSDMMTLLLAFFVLLFSFSKVDAVKYKKIADSLRKAIGKQNVVLESHEPDASSEPSLEEYDRLLDREMRKMKAQIEALVQEYLLNEYIQVEVGEQGVVVRISNMFLFDIGRAEINETALPVVAKLCDLLKRFPQYKVRVEGHTDDFPIHTERYPSNWELSTARASRIVRYFIESGIDPKRLSAEGFAFYHPIESNETPEGRAKNRRVDIVIRPSEVGRP